MNPITAGAIAAALSVLFLAPAARASRPTGEAKIPPSRAPRAVSRLRRVPPPRLAVTAGPLAGSAEKGALEAPPQSPVSPLLQDLRARLAWERGDPASSAALDAALARLLESPTARRLAEEFLKEKTKARVSFDPISGPRGETDWRKPVIRVRLSDVYLKDAEQRQYGLPETLGHELLGHGVSGPKARKAGLLEANNFYRNEEMNARLAGWVARAEIGGGLLFTGARDFLDRPEAYYRSLQLVNAGYAETFSLREMAAPLAPLKARLKRVETALKQARGDADGSARLGAIKGRLESLIKRFSDPRESRALKRAAQAPFFAEAERRAADLRARLKTLLTKEDRSKRRDRVIDILTARRAGGRLKGKERK